MFSKKVKKTQQTSINQCTVIQPYFCCNIHNGRDALIYFGSRQVTEFSQQLAILNPTRSDFKYPSDFEFLKKCRIPSDSDADAESVTSLACGILDPLSRTVAAVNSFYKVHRLLDNSPDQPSPVQSTICHLPSPVVPVSVGLLATSFLFFITWCVICTQTQVHTYIHS